MSKSHLEDPSQPPKFNPSLGRIERLGRLRKTTIPYEGEAKRARMGQGQEGGVDGGNGGDENVDGEELARQKNTRKLEECINVITKYFVNMHGFLLCWNSINSNARDKFLTKGEAADMIQR